MELIIMGVSEAVEGKYEIKDNVLHGLYRSVGLKTPGQGIAFSLPVDGAVGPVGDESKNDL